MVEQSPEELTWRRAKPPLMEEGKANDVARRGHGSVWLNGGTIHSGLLSSVMGRRSPPATSLSVISIEKAKWLHGSIAANYGENNGGGSGGEVKNLPSHFFLYFFSLVDGRKRLEGEDGEEGKGAKGRGEGCSRLRL